MKIHLKIAQTTFNKRKPVTDPIFLCSLRSFAANIFVPLLDSETYKLLLTTFAPSPNKHLWDLSLDS